jgi:hypothetical protein
VSDAGDLRARLERLLEEARETGALGSLRPALEAALAVNDPVAAPPSSGGEVPSQYGMVGASAPMKKGSR